MMGQNGKWVTQEISRFAFKPLIGNIKPIAHNCRSAKIQVPECVITAHPHMRQKLYHFFNI